MTRPAAAQSPATRQVVGVLGGGQLGRMLGLAGIPLGIECRFLDPGGRAAAAADVGAVVGGELADADAALRAVDGADVVTYEWEGVPAATARTLAAAGYRVHPNPDALEVTQDRAAEKEAFRRLDIPTAPHMVVDELDGLRRAVANLGTPAILKTRRGGYDGKGQYLLRTPADADGAWAQMGGADLLLEGFVDFDRELSVLAVRGADGDVRTWPLVENHHERGILRSSVSPAPGIDDATRERATQIATAVLRSLDYVGVLAIELFATPNGLVANEMAPRVHNSGHWTIEGAETSQFENHLRAILGLPLGAVDARGASAMVNIVGAYPDRDRVLAIAGTHWHDYGKLARPGRKLGHITVTAADPSTRDQRLAAVLALSRDEG